MCGVCVLSARATVRMMLPFLATKANKIVEPQQREETVET